jgi:hypothetical protein
MVVAHNDDLAADSRNAAARCFSKALLSMLKMNISRPLLAAG